MSREKNVTPLSEQEKDYYKRLNIILETEEDLDKMKSIHSAAKIFLDKFDEINAEGLQAYSSIISDTAKLYREIKLDNSLDVSNFYTYMLCEGLFSQNRKYYFNIKLSNIFRSLGHFGLTIMNQEGVCLNNVFLLDRILSEFDFERAMVTNNIEKGKFDYRPDVERNIKNKHKNILLMKLICLLLNNVNKGNHICELINHNGVYYIYDPTNLCVFPINGNKKVQVLNGTVKLEIKPYSLFAMSDVKIEDIEKLMSLETTIPYEEASLIIKEAYERTLELYRSQTSLLNDFYDEIKNRIDIAASICERKFPFREVIQASYEEKLKELQK